MSTGAARGHQPLDHVDDVLGVSERAQRGCGRVGLKQACGQLVGGELEQGRAPEGCGHHGVEAGGQAGELQVEPVA